MELKRYARPLLALSAVLAIALLVAACGGTASGAANTTAASPAGGGGGATSVSIASYTFSPQTLTVTAGTTVTWTNNDSVPHNVVSTDSASTGASTTGTFSSGNLTKGQTFSFTFDKAGTYYYECSIHAAMAGMHGTVVVQ
jgi:plastocyanin